MQKNKIIVVLILSAFLLSSVLSVTAAQEENPTVTPLDSTIAPDSTINPEDTRIIDENETISSGEPILYAMDDNSTNTNATDTVDPAAEDGLLYANTIADQNTPDNSWIVLAIGVVLAVIVGCVISVVYLHKTKAKN